MAGVWPLLLTCVCVCVCVCVRARVQSVFQNRKMETEREKVAPFHPSLKMAQVDGVSLSAMCYPKA